MRITVLMLTLLGLLVLLLSGGLGLHAHADQTTSVIATGVVTSLNEGPYHAEVEVTGVDGRKFTYTENGSHRPLQVGRTVSVRYQPSAPAETAHIAGQGAYSLAGSLAVLGVLIVLAAWLSPLLTARFPNLFAFPIRR